jgi:hypothetical protein
MNLRLQKTVTHFFSSDVQSPIRSQVQFVVVSGFCVHTVECDEHVRGKEEFDIYLAGEG